jgi:pimeloyl-ACP methyl ester carboxylesterase
VPLHPSVEGSGSVAFVLVHGSMDRASSFRRLQSRLGEAEVVTYDRRGYAGSAGREPSDVFDDQIDDLIEVLDHRPVVALGHSLGGTIVLGAASRHPELIVGAVIWEAPMPWLDWWPTTTAGRLAAADSRPPEDVAESFVRRLIGDRVWDRLPSATRAQRRSEGPALVAEMRALSDGAPWDPADIAIPVIVGSGREGMAHQRRGSAELAAALPRGELVEVEGCGHGAHLTHPSELAAMLRRVAGIAASTTAGELAGTERAR